MQLGFVFDLDAEMIETRLTASRRNGEVHAGVVEHPFGVVRLNQGGLRIEQSGVKADRLLKIANLFPTFE